MRLPPAGPTCSLEPPRTETQNAPDRKPRRRLGFSLPRRGVIVALVVLALGAAAGVAATHVLNGGATSTRPLPQKAWALGCIARWNGPEGATIRRLVANGGPFNYEIPTSTGDQPALNRHVAGTPESVSFYYNWPTLTACKPLVTFKDGAATTSLGFESIAARRTRPRLQRRTRSREC